MSIYWVMEFCGIRTTGTQENLESKYELKSKGYGFDWLVLAQPTVSQAISRGQKIAEDLGLSFRDQTNQ